MTEAALELVDGNYNIVICELYLMKSLEINFDEQNTCLIDFSSDKSITRDYFDWQLSNFQEYRKIRGNVFYDRSVLLLDIHSKSSEAQIIGELLGYLGSLRLHSGDLNSANFVVKNTFDLPLIEGFEELWANFHKPSYQPPTLLTLSELINQMESLFRRGMTNGYALERLNELKELLDY